ncbi:hypothetical protein OUZ56_006229 [Daphnia magna]|uniref:Uncharacterized protein n=1 Tax=Daphnia magna TaxID=35525 RepID=A0ABQ9YWD2_9CRUS|nr:hypothetical protein OUZ56_006229 [Daphnia magna]
MQLERRDESPTGDSTEFTLRWHHHDAKLADTMTRAWEKKLFLDVTLASGHRTLEKEVLEGTRQRASLSWDSFDLPVFKADTEKNNQIVLTTAPDNWWELDGLTLQGSYHLIIDKLFDALTKRNLKIAAQSAVRLNQKDCLILWFPSSVDYFSLDEWFDETIETLIAEVKLKIVLEEEMEEELSEKTEGLELADTSVDSEVKSVDIELNNGEPDYQPIEFRLIIDPDERDDLVKRLEKELKDSVESESLRMKEDDDKVVESV